MINWQMFSIFIIAFIVVVIPGFWAARWRSGDLSRIQEWGLAGRRFGALIVWFLLGSDIYTAYSFIAIPGLVFGQGALGFYIIPYVVLAFPIIFVILPRFWTLARHRGYITAADFVRDRFGNTTLALLIALTGILATLPYIALQILGMQVVLAQMGLRNEFALLIAFAVLAAFTYLGGLRAPALISVVKDLLIWLAIAVAFFVIIGKFGSLGALLETVPKKKLLLAPAQYSAYATLALGSAVALFLYPHALTGLLSANSHRSVKRTILLLPFYSIILVLLSLLGYAAAASGIKAAQPYGANAAIPALFAQMLPPWFSGFAFAMIVISALIPASIMSIAAANLFSRNIYRVYFRASCSEDEESQVARLASLAIKFGALVFILAFPSTSFANNLQLLGGVWILQTLPAVFIGIYTNQLHSRALILGWLGGMIVGTWIVLTQNFASVYVIHIGTMAIAIYAGLIAVMVNLCISGLLTFVFRLSHVPSGRDFTSPTDFETQPTKSQQWSVSGGLPAPQFSQSVTAPVRLSQSQDTVTQTSGHRATLGRVHMTDVSPSTRMSPPQRQ